MLSEIRWPQKDNILDKSIYMKYLKQSKSQKQNRRWLPGAGKSRGGEGKKGIVF